MLALDESHSQPETYTLSRMVALNGGVMARSQGGYPSAAACYGESIGDRRGMAECLESEAALVGAPISLLDRAAHERLHAEVRRFLGEEKFASAFVEGQTLGVGLPEARAFAWSDATDG